MSGRNGAEVVHTKHPQHEIPSTGLLRLLPQDCTCGLLNVWVHILSKCDRMALGKMLRVPSASKCTHISRSLSRVKSQPLRGHKSAFEGRDAAARPRAQTQGQKVLA